MPTRQSGSVPSLAPVPATRLYPLHWAGRADFERLAPLIRILLIVAVVAVLEMTSAMGVTNQLVVPRPSEVTRELVSNVGFYGLLLATTLYETAVAFAGSAVIGSLLGYYLWRKRNVALAVEPILVGLFASPLILLYPILLIFFGRTANAVVVQAMLAGIVPVVISTQAAFRGVRATHLKAASMLCLNRRQMFGRVLIPAAVPGVVAGLRLGMTYTLLTVLAAEYLTSIGGLGAAISNASALLRTDQMYAALSLVLLLTSGFLYSLGRLERRFVAKAG